MTCCKANEFKWCQELETVYKDPESGFEYCAFHAPEGCKGKIEKEEFETLIFQRIDEAISNRGVCNLSGTIFQWPIDFRSYNKENPLPKVLFHKASFLDAVLFSDVTFGDQAYLGSVTFKREANFRGVVFSGEAHFSEAIFFGKTSFRKAMFSGATYFGRSYFKSETYFVESIFENKTHFAGVTFGGAVSYHYAKFIDEVSFLEAIFTGQAYFGKVFFSNKSHFPDTKFGGVANFRNVTFKGEGNFRRSIFNDEAHFGHSVFSNKAYFSNTVFRSTVEFEDTTFNDENDFKRSIFLAKGFFRNTKFEKVAKFQDIVVDAYLVFDSVSMENVSFTGTNVSNFVFAGKCTWPKCKELVMSNRDAIYDDIALNKDSVAKDYEAAALIYRQLKQAKKESHDEVSASIWHYGEKEMFRKEHWWRKWPISITFWYWLSSGYGERPVRAGIFLVGLFIFLVAFLNLVGLTNGSISFRGFSGPFNMSSFLILIKTTLQYALFAKPPIFEPIGNFGHIILLVMTRLILPIQAALFGFALRNRFRR